MKTSKRFTLSLSLSLSLIFSFFLVSCENFLNGSEVKSQLDSIIKEANAPKVQIYIKADENAGSVSPAGLFECKLDSSFLILFEPQDGYEFLKWEAVDRNTGDPLTGAVAFEDETKSETRATVKKNIENIRIQPVYVTLPSIVSTAPAYSDAGVYANMPIEVTFNIPMINEDGSAVNFSFDNISIQAAGIGINEYFYDPELSSDGKSLKIVPKALEFTEYILKEGKKAVDVQVAFKTEQISIVLGEKAYNLFKNSNAVFTYKVNSTLEKGLPECDNLTVSTIQDGANLPVEGNSETQFTSLDVINEHAVAKYVYLHGEAFDADSGIKSIVLEETLLNAKDGAGVNHITKKFVYDTKDLEIIREENKQIEFKLQHELSVDDGRFSLEVYAEDYCGNKSTITKYMLIKDTYIGIDDIYVFNYLFNINHSFGMWGYYWTNVNKTQFAKEINNVKIMIQTDLEQSCFNGGSTPVPVYNKTRYDSFDYPLEDLIVECEYISKEGPVHPRMVIKDSKLVDMNKTSKYWALENGLNVDSVAGLKFKIRISDDLGNSEEKEFQFPSVPDNIKEISKYSSYSYNVYFNSYVPCNGCVSFYTDDDNVCWRLEKNDGTEKRAIIGGAGSTYSKDISLYNQEENFSLFGPLHTFAVADPVSVSSNAENREEALNLLVPTVTYAPGAPGSGSVIVTMKFDDQVWNYWDEIQFDDLYSDADDPDNPYYDPESAKKPHLITKNNSTYVFEDEYGLGYTDGTAKFTMKGVKTYDVLKDENNDITQIKTTSGQKDFTLPVLLESCYTFAPKIALCNRYEIVDGQLLICPVTVTLVYDTQEIKRVIYTQKYGTQHTDGYVKKDGSGKQIRYYYPVESFLEFGDVTIAVEDQKGNTSASKVITKPDMPYILKIVDKTHANLSESINTNGRGLDPQIHFSVFENSGWSEDYYYSHETIYDERLQIVPELANFDPKEYPEKKFLRFYYIEESKKNETPFRRCSRYSYLYYDSNDTESHIGYILDDNRGVSVYSEQPVFVYTLSTKRPYDECSQWDVSDWEDTFHRASNEVVWDLNNQIKRYQLDLSKLESGDNYVVIAHFADGHTDMSSVRHFE